MGFTKSMYGVYKACIWGSQRICMGFTKSVYGVYNEHIWGVERPRDALAPQHLRQGLGLRVCYRCNSLPATLIQVIDSVGGVVAAWPKASMVYRTLMRCSRPTAPGVVWGLGIRE